MGRLSKEDIKKRDAAKKRVEKLLDNTQTLDKKKSPTTVVTSNDNDSGNSWLEKQVEGLTPGGSEFHNDIDRCIEFLKHLPKMNVKLKLDYKRLEQECKLQFAELVKMKENIDKVYRR